MMDNDNAWLILAGAGVSWKQLPGLLEQYGSAAAIVAEGATRLPQPQRKAVEHPDRAAIDAALTWAGDAHHSLIHPESASYPALLRQIDDVPTLLYVVGKPAVLDLPALAIVGSRNPTRDGLRTAFEFSRHLSGGGFNIVSGLAQGIDTAAHQGALAVPAATVAVLGHGIDRVYPAANRELAHSIAEVGALVSEYPLGSPPRREHFPQRNRLISGLAVGTLVIEAARRSGSLITARLAASQGREVFAIPGSIHNPLSRGCHQLIRDGARLVETVADIASELGPLTGHLMQNTLAEPPETKVDPLDERDAEYGILLSSIGFDPISADELGERCGLTIAQVSSMLLILELEGIVEATPGGLYSRLGTTD